MDVININLTIPPEVIHLSVAAAVGLLVGAERAIHEKVASFTTFAMISLGSCLFTKLSLFAATLSVTGTADPARIAAQVVSGIGFVGAGVIFKDKDNIEGVTTAVMLWLSAALGMACGFGEIDLALWSAGLYFFALVLSKKSHNLVDLFKNKNPTPKKK